MEGRFETATSPSKQFCIQPFNSSWGGWGAFFAASNTRARLRIFWSKPNDLPTLPTLPKPGSRRTREQINDSCSGVTSSGPRTERNAMPSLAKRPCSVPGCPGFAQYRACCLAHAQLNQRTRGTTKERGYDQTWKRLRRQKLVANPLCEIKTHCKGLFPDNAATEVDHVIPIRERPDLRLVWENLQSACGPCHRAKTARESSGWGP
jgi:5-methylcytosine-specific restriction protein A